MPIEGVSAIGSLDEFLILDIETAPDRDAMISERAKGCRDAGAALHEIRAAAALTARRSGDGSWCVDRIQCWWQPDFDEFSILLALENQFRRIADVDGMVVGFNSRRHDLPTIRRRAARHLMMDLAGWNEVDARHLDLMTHGIAGPSAPWCSLSATCGPLRIPVEHAFPAAADATRSVVRRKCETDVCAQFVVLAYALSMARQDRAVLERGWAALAETVRRDHAQRPHLLQFAGAWDNIILNG